MVGRTTLGISQPGFRVCKRGSQGEESEGLASDAAEVFKASSDSVGVQLAHELL